MADDYEVVGYILKPRDSGGGCLGCLVFIVLLCAIGPCICDRLTSGRSTDSQQASGVVQQEQTSSGYSPAPPPSAPRVVETKVRCRSCAGRGMKTVKAKCPVCGGRRKVVDQVKTAQRAMERALNARGRRPPKPKTFYMSCPECGGRGSVSHKERCPDCNGNGFLIKRETRR